MGRLLVANGALDIPAIHRDGCSVPAIVPCESSFLTRCLHQERHLGQGDKSQRLLREDGPGAEPESQRPCCEDAPGATVGDLAFPSPGRQGRRKRWPGKRLKGKRQRGGRQGKRKRNGGGEKKWGRNARILEILLVPAELLAPVVPPRARNLYPFPSIFPEAAPTP